MSLMDERPETAISAAAARPQPSLECLLPIRFGRQPLPLSGLNGPLTATRAPSEFYQVLPSLIEIMLLRTGAIAEASSYTEYCFIHQVTYNDWVSLRVTCYLQGFLGISLPGELFPRFYQVLQSITAISTIELDIPKFYSPVRYLFFWDSQHAHQPISGQIQTKLRTEYLEFSQTRTRKRKVKKIEIMTNTQSVNSVNHPVVLLSLQSIAITAMSVTGIRFSLTFPWLK